MNQQFLKIKSRKGTWNSFLKSTMRLRVIYGADNNHLKTVCQQQISRKNYNFGPHILEKTKFRLIFSSLKSMIANKFYETTVFPSRGNAVLCYMGLSQDDPHGIKSLIRPNGHRAMRYLAASDTEDCRSLWISMIYDGGMLIRAGIIKVFN